MKARFLGILIACVCGVTQAQTMSASQQNAVLSEIGDEYQNSIPILQNRFRIDFRVDEITMVFFREYGSAPVVLVRPDGSKLFQSRYSEDIEHWSYAANWDLIKLTNPTPGPWQAMGQILPGSRIMILSDITLFAEPLPQVLFAGEILKQTAYLTNGGEPIDQREFNDVVELNIEFASANNPNYDNFGADNQVVARFSDSGRGMDEYPDDGIFTGQYNLNIPSGEWVPVYKIETPLFSREQRQQPVRVYPNPVKLDVEQAAIGTGEYHQLSIDVNRDLIDINSLLVDGKIRFPNGELRNFSLTQPSAEARVQPVFAGEYGVYRIKLTAFGNTTDGRNFILDVPEYSFLVEQPPSAADELPTDTTDNENTVIVPDPQQSEESSSNLGMIIFIAVNGVIILVALVFGFFIFRRARSSSKTKVEEQSRVDNAAEDELLELDIPDKKD